VAVDRDRLPAVGEPAPLRFPAIERETLSNGARLWTVDHRETELIGFMLLVPSGSSADPPGYEGLAAFTADLLDDGTRRRTSIDLHEELGRIGGRLGTDVSSDATVLSITALARHARDALALLTELATEPRFDPEEVDRVRALRTGRIAQVRQVAAAVAERAFLRSVYAEHPYGHPPAGTETALARIAIDDIRAFHAAHYAPDRWTLVVAGGGRRVRGSELAAVASAVPAPAASPARAEDRCANGGLPGASPLPARMTFVPRPGAVQSEIRIGHLGVERCAADYAAVTVMNMVLGGQFVSRLNSNLRETRGYTYGVRTAFDGRRGVGPFTLQTAVDAAVTADAIGEAVREIRQIRDVRPVTEAELAAARPALTNGYARNFETLGQVAHAALRLALFGLPDDEYSTFVSRVARVDVAAAARAADRRLDPGALQVVVVGPPDVRPGLAGLGLGEPVEATVDEFFR
jgi:predicted Zn-dependent peptidase